MHTGGPKHSTRNEGLETIRLRQWLGPAHHLESCGGWRFMSRSDFRLTEGMPKWRHLRANRLL